MSVEDFQLINDTSVDTSIFERDYMIIYNQQGAQLNVFNHGTDSFFGENNNYHQIGIVYLEFDITLKVSRDFNNIDGDGNVDEPIRLVNNASGYTSSIAALSISGGEGIEQAIYVGHLLKDYEVFTTQRWKFNTTIR